MTEAPAATQPARLSDAVLDQLFRQARTHSAWLPKRVSTETLREVYELARMGPTSANSSPARCVFLESEAAKARLLPALSATNVEKTKTAPVNVIVAWHTEFYEKLPSCSLISTCVRFLPGTRRWPRKMLCATVRCKVAISYWRLAPWDWIAARCQASTRPKWMPNFSPTANGKSTSSAISDTATAANYFQEIRGWTLTRLARCLRIPVWMCRGGGCVVTGLGPVQPGQSHVPRFSVSVSRASSRSSFPP